MSASGSWDVKVSFAIRYPSSFIGGQSTIEKNLVPIERFSTTENINQVTVDSVNEAHIGFATALGEFTGTFTIYETSDRLAFIDELISKNLYFDIVMVSTDESEESDWKVEQTLLVGCKITRRDRSYEYGRVPLRTYSFKYLKVRDSETSDDGNVYEIPFGNGIFNVSVTSGSTPDTPGKSTTIESTGE